MSTVIKSIFISAIDASFKADDIIEEFYCQNIATISRITLVPYESKTGVRNKAYIDIHEWHPTEAAYNLIKRIKDDKTEARFVHSDDNWCVVGVNKNTFITNSKKMSKFTTINYLVEDDSLEFKGLPWVLSSSSQDDPDWISIEKDLSEMLAYQNLEYELCL
jgi:hypothetical protein